MFAAILLLFAAIKIINIVEGRYTANPQFSPHGTTRPINRVRYFQLPSGKKNGEVKDHQLTERDREYLQVLHRVLRESKFDRMKKDDAAIFFRKLERIMAEVYK